MHILIFFGQASEQGANSFRYKFKTLDSSLYHYLQVACFVTYGAAKIARRNIFVL